MIYIWELLYSFQNLIVSQELGNGEGTAKWMLDEIANSESDAERSLMHRFVLG